ncbi:MAG TPA: hypothetical protein VM074_07780 [Solimonas sp.]|nr:hypothetical protein [Solimonas sp.]
MSVTKKAARVVLAVSGLSGCATSGGWMGVESEKAYDKDLEIRRLAEVLNNDDYYEFERDGRIYVLSDARDFTGFLKTAEIPYSTKLIGGGPGGKTIIYGLVKNETKMLEKEPRSQGAAQKMYEGKLEGLEQNFFAVVIRENKAYVFSSWNDLEAFRNSGSASGYVENNGPEGRNVVFVNASAKPQEAATRFARLYQ